jgi:tRNA(Ile)-lysidine synthase
MEESYDYLMNELKIKYGDTVVAGVSGGPDSMALLSLLIQVKKALDIEIVCAHVNHNTGRPGQFEEQKFVEKFCRNHNVIFETMTIEDYGDDNFHNEAHTKRYNYFSGLIKKYNAKYLFTAHHGDDLIETILMRIVRGSTLRGYSGFSKEIDKGSYKIVRPLMNLTKDEILAYDKKNKIPYALDSSNQKDVYTRNRFRKYIVPEFKKEDKNVHNKFYKFSRTLIEYNEYIDKEVAKKIKTIYIDEVLNVEKFIQEDKVIQMKIIYYILEHIYQDDLMLVTDRHAEILCEVINSKRANVKVHLPNNVQAIKSYNTLVLANLEQKRNEYEIEINKFVNLPNGRNIEVVDKSDATDNYICRLSKEDVVLPLHVRTRKDGDKMAVKGMIGNKKINDIFINEKISTNERDLWPVVVDNEENIVWLPGLKKSKFDKQKDENYDIILKYY